MATDHFSLFQEALNHQDRPHRVILFADLAGSTEMKGKTGEVGWLPTIGKFLDITTRAVTEHGGTVVKYLGDGTLAVFDGERAAEAICAAITIQELLKEENSRGSVNDCLATVGIATGRVVEYQAPGGGLDYIGSVVDLAARLCGAGAPQAIWVDSVTVASANMSKVSSGMGRALEYSPDDYLSDEEKVDLKGFAKPIKYREVIWHKKAFGVKNTVLTEAIDRAQTQAHVQVQQNRLRARATVPPQAGPSARPVIETLDGTVTRWDPEQGRGFIATAGHGDHYVDRRFLVNEQNLTEGGAVRFVPLPPLKEGQRPVAGCTVQEGHEIRGTFQNVRTDKGYGFVEVRDTRGNQQNLFVFLGDAAAGHRFGDPATLEVRRNHKGISGQLVGVNGTDGGDDGGAGSDLA
ncbi:adenylate/guanylate cyclase domain-containing protein [Streptomyces viridosporus]|uniref:Adenylate/guanylate cyclase domain-containing protein n=1 Tax=Streptomyces viridosporus T7A TaxID=665577 RepID=A0ABX6ACC1_STRVD|nr:adenylate/guanylate cyclase domain-containing protein [Streptomyces viridosporus]QEU85407.1 adenylate/guanylate cyclase domain-containing protein [Streptomyces viridosporus T7A]